MYGHKSDRVEQHTVESLMRHGSMVASGSQQPLEDTEAVLHGLFTREDYSSGVSIHTSDMLENQDAEVSIDLTPRLTLCVLLEGCMEFTVDGKHHHLDTRRQGSLVFAIVTDRQQILERHVRAGRRVCKVNVAVSKEWLVREAAYSQVIADILEQYFRGTNRFMSWPASKVTGDLAQRVLCPQHTGSHMQRVQVEYHAIELLHTVLNQLSQQGERQTELAINRAQSYIESQLHASPSLNQVASHAGMSVSTLQRQFKERYQQTVMQYIRRRKLELARDALSKMELSIGEAAFQAGYHHVSNFVTAYKQVFGVTPGEHKQPRTRA